MSSFKKKLINFTSPKRFKGEIKKRPYVWVFFGVLIFYALISIWGLVNFDSEINLNITVSLLFGLLSSLAAYQWQLNRPIVQPLIAILTIANFIILHISCPFHTARFIGYWTIFTALIFAIFFRPFLGSKDNSSLSYTVAAFISLAKCFITAFIINVALVIILASIFILLGAENLKLQISLFVLFGIAVPFIIFLFGLPLGKQKKVSVLSLSRFAKIILLPLSLVYIIVLYIYGLKILILWELPQGTICSMVTWITLVGLIVIYVLRGYLYSPDATEKSKAIATIASRWLPILLLPLLVLMSVAIFYRINQYGITAPRLYIVFLNIWAYCAIAYILLRRNPDFNALACSFAFALAAVSAIPGANLYTWGTRNEQSREGEDEYYENEDKFVTLEGDSECEELVYTKLVVSPVPQANSVRYIYDSKRYDQTSNEQGCIPIDIDGSIRFELPVDSLFKAHNNCLLPAAVIIPQTDRTIAIISYSMTKEGEQYSVISLSALIFEN